MGNEPAAGEGGTDGHALGGRLPLLPVEGLRPDQAHLHQRLTATRTAAAQAAGYTAALPDGRLIGPFNAFLRAPALADAQLDWIQAIADVALPPRVREATILTVGAHWAADYILYAHSRAAQSAGLASDAITALCEGQPPRGVDPAVLSAQRLALGLVRDHVVPDDVYADAVAAFGEDGLVALLALIGQYQATAAVLTCFQVPAPQD